MKAKPDRKDYPVLRADDEYNSWRDVFYAVLHAHQLQVVLAISFEPSNPTEYDCFRRINWWVYMVLTHTIKTHDGKAIVYNHRHTYDARQVLYLLHAHYTVSTTGVITAQ